MIIPNSSAKINNKSKYPYYSVKFNYSTEYRDNISTWKQIITILIIINIFIYPVFLIGGLSESGYSDVVYSDEHGWAQPFIENTPVNISLTNSNILYILDIPHDKKYIPFYVEANYTLYNGNSENKNINLISPFPSFFQDDYNTTLIINDELIPYNYSNLIYNENHYSYIHFNYLFPLGYEGYTSIVCNITIPKNKSITITFRLESVVLPQYDLPNYSYYIKYLLFTDENWDLLPTSVSINFQIYGKYPDYK